MRCLLRVILPLLLGLSLGCGGNSSPYTFAPVKGRVLLNNLPLAKATVRFQPDNSAAKSPPPPDSYGETDDDGYFTLKPVGKGYEGLDGAVVGKHYIQITRIDRDSGAGQTIPARYNRNSKEERTVPPEGLKEEIFRLNSP